MPGYSTYDDGIMNRFNFACRFGVFAALLFCTFPLLAKDARLQTIDWPSTGTPIVRFTLSKFKSLPEMGNLHGYIMNCTAQNLSPRRIPSARFNVYLFDKNKVRVGDDAIAIQNVGPGEIVKFETTVATSGQPVSVSIEDAAATTKTVSITVNSTPQGATLAVDGTATGVTPRLINIGAGHHTLTFTKEGFTSGAFPLDISANDVSGGSVSYELGALAFDTIELRDGTVLNGDLISITGMDAEIRIGGAIQHIDRNNIKRVLFVHRNAPDVPAANAPGNN